ncbi:MAG: BBP7 family outer membrane beta-barrel protein [Pirellulales bacterium]|nr:BBP7 family outer membrane beta-barrel protein [Pirellulales bacterium]
MMKSVRRMSALVVLSGLLTAPAYAQDLGAASYQTGRYAQPSLLPEYQPAPAVMQTAGQQPYGSYTVAARRGTEGLEAAPAPVNPPSVVSGSPSDETVTAQPLPPTGDCGAGCNGGTPIFSAPGYGCSSANPWTDAVSGNCASGACDVCLPTCCPNWSVYVGGVVMSRDSSNKKWLTYETGNNANQLMYPPDADWGGGPEVRIMKAIGCNPCGGCPANYIEGVYYGVYGMDGYDSRYSPTNQLSTPLDVGFVNYVSAGFPAVGFFDNAREHRVWREDEFHNVEVNWVHYFCGGSPGCNGQPFSIAGVAGFRFIKFQDELLFGSVSSGNEFGSNGGVNEAYFTSDVDNNLYGFQIGALMSHRIGCNWNLFAAPKIGIFGNHIEFSTHGYRGDGATATFSTTGNAFNLSNQKDDFAVMGQLDLGVDYCINSNWKITGGYRVLGIAGVALADDQIPAYLAAENDWTDIESNGTLIMHGAFAGVTYSW